MDYEEYGDDEHHQGGDSISRGHERYMSSEVDALRINRVENCASGRMVGRSINVGPAIDNGVAPSQPAPIQTSSKELSEAHRWYIYPC